MEITNDDLRDMFEMLDSERSGLLDLQEMTTGFRALGLNPTEEHLDDIFRKANIVDDNKIDLDEFVRLFGKCERRAKISREELLD